MRRSIIFIQNGKTKKMMMKFKEWNEREQSMIEENDEHKNGTYINVKPTEEAKDTIFDWVSNNGINDPLDKNEYHVTVIYSKTPCPGAVNYDFNLPIEGTISGWKIFDAGIGRCLVASIQSEQLQTINADLKANYGATSDFPEYIPHITVSYNYLGEIPQNYPAMRVTFNQVEVKGLDPTWRPKKKEEDNGNN